jgi:hypothetical protein
LERFHQNLDTPHTVQEKGLEQQLKTPANPKKNTAAATEPREEMEEEQQAATESGQKQQQQQERRSNLSPQKL